MKKIRKTLIMTTLSCLLVISCNHVNNNQRVYNEGINIIPTPVSLIENEGKFILKNKSVISISCSDAKTVTDFFVIKINRATGFNILITEDSEKSDISLIIDNSLDMNDEGYTLDVTPEKIVVKAKTPQGLFYGMQTVMQLLPAEIESQVKVSGIEWSMPAVSITDEPRFSYRGMHIDPCRHFIPVENIKKHIDVLSLFKINRLHWHLTDDQGWRIEIKKYPKLTEIGSKRIEGEGFEHSGYYTQDEIREIVKYAADHYITVIPEIELPGHAMAAIAAYPELSCKGEFVTPRIIWGVEDIVFCAGKESTFEFLENVFAEIVELFPSEYVHIGGDECPKTEWKECPLCQKRIREEGLKPKDGHSSEERLQSYFIQRIEKVLAKFGKKIIGWDEILEGGLAPTATVMSWRGEQGGIDAANMGHDVIMTPASAGLYIDHYQGDYKIEPVTIGGYSTVEKIYSYNPIPKVLTENDKGHHIIGVQANTWSEYRYYPELLEYIAYPRILALAEIAWTPVERKNFEDFCRRLNNALVRLDCHNINYHIPQPEQPFGSCNFVAFTDKALLQFKITRPIKMVYTLDGSEPSPNSTEYSQPIELYETTNLKIRSVLPSGKMSPTRSIRVEKQVSEPAKTIENLIPGLKMLVTRGMYLNVDEMEKGAKDWEESAIKSLREITRVVKTDESMRGVEQYAAIATGYVDIPEDGVYYFSSDNEEVWINGKLLINNRGETKRFSRNDKSVALAKGLHEIKVVFLGHIIGGWPSNWNNGNVNIRKENSEKFEPVTPEMLFMSTE